MSDNTQTAIPDISFDSIQDLNQLPPKGRYLCNLTLSARTLKDVPYLGFKYKVLETIELVDPEAVVPKDAGFEELFNFDVGIQVAKPKLKAIIEGLGFPGDIKLADLIEAAQNIQVEVTLNHRADNKDPTKVYANIPGNTFKLA